MTDSDYKFPAGLGLWYVTGDETIMKLDSDLPSGAKLVMSQRQKALALALLDHALNIVHQCEIR